MSTFSRRKLLLTATSAAVASPFVGMRSSRAATKVRFLMSWFAEAEHGVFYQAKANGIYEKAGFDVELKQGGPQINTLQLLLGGEADMILSYDLQVLSGLERGMPIKVIATSFQTDLLGIMTRPNVKSLGELKGRKIYVGANAYATYWPWLKTKYGFTDDMAAPKGAGLQTFMNDPTSAAAGYITAEPYYAQKANTPVNFLLFSAEGWPAYTNPIVTTDSYIAANGERITDFLRASMEGWKSYMTDPKAGNDLIKQMNPQMDDGHIAFSLARMREINCLGSGDAAQKGIGTMSDERWKRIRDFMVGANLLKAETDWKKAYTTSYIDKVRVIL